MLRAVDRLAVDDAPVSVLNPVTLAVAIFRLVDRLNERPATAGKGTFVNVLVKARKQDRS
jgi:hypothetical protein